MPRGITESGASEDGGRCALTGVLAALLLLLIPVQGIAETPADRAGIDFFESRIRPLLTTHCQGCHGPSKRKGGLRLDDRARLLSGGETGPAVFPGRPDESLLINAVTYGDDLKMPPKGKLPDQDISALRRWVAMGAPWPGPGAEAEGSASTTKTTEPAGAAFWAFQPPEARSLPMVKNGAWVGSPIDAFVLSALEEKGLTPAPQADRRTLIRRVYYDLIGLPPSPEEVEAFMADPSPDAYVRLVERLLASPHYGERWGRHWLDVARYADSNGMDENLAFAHAWRYRDYVVDSFNANLPFDEFLREQVAGDLLPPSDNPARDRRRLAATGFLVIGPKMLAEDDPVKMEMDIVDEQVDTVGKAFLGMTLGCARCHDHKFDPISTGDYYGLAGIFKSTRTMEHFRVVARWNERPLASASEIAAREARLEPSRRKHAEIDGIVKRANQAILDELRKRDPKAPPKLPEKPETHYPKTIQSRLVELRRAVAAMEARIPPYAPVMAVADREVSDLRVHIRGNHLTLGPVVSRRFPVVLAGTKQPPFESTRSGRLELAAWLTRPDHALTSRVIVNRVWLWHFGAGLVRSPDNFGRLGERPTHPALLDWLARKFISGGWSMKELHREILLSSTYRMSSTHDARAALVDPENRLLWRFNRRRLEAEAIRDGILAVSGQLDRSMGGSLLQSRDREYVAGTASVNKTNYDTNRRSIYLPVVRSALYEVLQAFDFPDPSTGSGQREITTVAPQALCLMNSNLIASASRAMAKELVDNRALDSAGRVARIYERSLGRRPEDHERERALAFLARYEQTLASDVPAAERRIRAIQGLCRVVLSSSEMVFID